MKKTPPDNKANPKILAYFSELIRIATCNAEALAHFCDEALTSKLLGLHWATGIIAAC